MKLLLATGCVWFGNAEVGGSRPVWLSEMVVKGDPVLDRGPKPGWPAEAPMLGPVEFALGVALGK